MPDFLMNAYVIWFLIGFLLALAELSAPGFIIIFFGIGCWVVSLVTAFVEISMTWQISIFIVASVLSLLLLRKYFMRVFTGAHGEDDGVDSLDNRSDIGKTVQVTKTTGPVITGEIKYRGTFWRAVSDEDIAEGSMAVIVSGDPDDKSTFKIAPVSK